MIQRVYNADRARTFMCVLFLLCGFMPREVHAADTVVQEVSGIYKISCREQLLYLSRNFGTEHCPADGHYVLTADIDMAGVEDFAPLRGNFLGRFDGQCHVIRNLTIRRPEQATLGLFCNVGDAVTQAVVENLALVNVYVLGRNTVGAIAGALYGTIRNCYVSGEVHAMMHCAGGVVGRLPEIVGQRVTPLMRDCFSSAAVVCEGEADSQGGLSGRLLSIGGVIENCICTGEVIGQNKTGGLLGQMAQEGHLRCCVAANRWLESAVGSRSAGSVVGLVEEGADISQTAAWNVLGKRTGAFSDGVITAQTASFSDAKFYESLGWKFDGTWCWKKSASGREYPALSGFESLPFDYDFSWYERQIPVRVRTESDTCSITLKLEVGTEQRNVTYCVMKADRGLPAVAVWQSEPETCFEGLQPAKAYSFCYKVKDGSGKESRWYRTTVNTGYRISTDKNPRNIVAVVTDNPSSSISFGWTTLDTMLTSSTVWIVPERDSARLMKCPYQGTNHVESVRGTINKRLYDGARKFHRVRVDGLKSSTRYLYRVGDAVTGIMSPIRGVKTASVQKNEFQFVYVADLQVDTPVSVRAIRRMYENILERMPHPDFLYLAGDMTENGYNYTQWDRFFEVGDTLFRDTFVVPVQGNHDSDGDLANHFPIVSMLEKVPFVYSFDYGCVHFMVLNTQYWDEYSIRCQMAWLERDLKENRRRWNIVLLHKALYAATDHVDDEDINFLRGRVATCLEKWGVDAVLMGHDHSFTRSFVREGRNARVSFVENGGRQVFRSPSAPFYMVNGTGGISKWYYKIRYDASKLIRVSPDYEFVDKTSADYDSSLREQSFTLVKVTPEKLVLDTWFFRCAKDNAERYEKEPYLFDSIEILK